MEKLGRGNEFTKRMMEKFTNPTRIIHKPKEFRVTLNDIKDKHPKTDGVVRRYQASMSDSL